MNSFNALRRLLTTCLFATSTFAVAAPTLLVSNGLLTEAKNVNVDGTFYDVKFALGSCDQVFNGCAESAFTFHTNESAQAAGKALLEQVYIDSPEGNFGSWPYNVPGCNTYDYCLSYVPYGYRDTAWTSEFPIFVFARAFHFYSNRLPDFVDGDVGYYPNVYITGDYSNFAVFTLSDEQPVPEPASLALVGLALFGMIALRRRSN